VYIIKETVEMFNKQLRHNIGALDAQIGELSKELEGLKKDTKYDVKIRTLGDLIEFRSKLVKNQGDEKSDVVIELDKQIEELTMIIYNVESDEEYTAKLQKLEDLTKIRCQLSDAKVKESNAPAVMSSLVGLGAIVLVLKHEKADIITSKAFSIATKMFRGF
jgi:predicted RNase H-like nuclease (RuvC/YqgF family)